MTKEEKKIDKEKRSKFLAKKYEKRRIGFFGNKKTFDTLFDKLPAEVQRKIVSYMPQEVKVPVGAPKPKPAGKKPIGGQKSELGEEPAPFYLEE